MGNSSDEKTGGFEGGLAKELSNMCRVVNFDAAGRLIKRSLGNGSYTDQTYDNASHLTVLANKRSNGQVLSSFAYQRDTVANITQIEMTQENADQTTTHNFLHYTYPEIYRLTGEVRKDETDTNTIYTRTFTYDPNGNRLQLVKTGTIGALGVAS